jgi:exosortase
VTDRSPWIKLLLLVAASVLLWWQPLVSCYKLALSNEAYTHILLILPLGLALLYVKIRELSSAKEFSAGLAANYRSGGALLFLAFLLRIITARNIGALSQSDNLSLSILSVVICWIGVVIVCFGSSSVQRLLFPLCFLFLLVPFPDRLLNPITSFLQYQSALGASFLFHLARVPVTRDGVMLSIPGLDIEVAPECSSIRSSMMLIVITLTLAYLFLDSYWNRTLLVLVAIPLSVAKNAVRIFTIAELSTRVDPSFLTGRLHRQGGIVFLSLAVITVVWLLWILRKRERPPRSALV